jgi:hypothetical protein
MALSHKAKPRPRKPWRPHARADQYVVKPNPRDIMSCLQRLNDQEAKALGRAMFICGAHRLPNIHTRKCIRAWYRERWEYLVDQYEKAIFEESGGVNLPPR